MELTVAEVSGLIATGVFILQLLLPLAIPWILIAFLSDENSVITWTVLGRFLHSSLWPSILGTSTAATEGVQWRVYWTSWIQTVILFIISVASICSPLGLYMSVEPAGTATQQAFAYLQDNSSFGYGTPPRPDTPFTRVCGEVACPGSWFNETCTKMGLAEVCADPVYESRIPGDLMNLFNDGANDFSPTVSSIFDIQYRTYRNSTDAFSNLPFYSAPDFHTMAVLVLEEDVKLVEGLVVDLKSGGVGFRNHTAPTSHLRYGATWTEDLLFIEPETQCVSLNISLDTIRSPEHYDGWMTSNMSLTDHGGFSGLSRLVPDIDHDEKPNPQGGFDLKERAYRAAWINNFFTMAYLDITDADSSDFKRIDSQLGQKFAIPDRANYSIGYSNIKTTIDFGDYLDLNTSSSNKNRTYNPHGISLQEFSAARTTCGGTTGFSFPNINSSLIGCGLVFGAASRTDGGSDLLNDPLSHWTIPLYSCASAVKAVVKTVEFKFNGTGFDALAVQSVQPKNYTSPASIPVWAVESIHDQNFQAAQPIWGIVGPNSTNHEDTITRFNMSTITKESLYLPGYMDDLYYKNVVGPVPLAIGQNLPAIQFFNQALFLAYSITSPSGQPWADYSGATSRAMYAKWQHLAKTTEDMASIINLIWTDVSASAVVGTRGWGLRAAQATMGIPNTGADTNSAIAADLPGGSSTPSVPVNIWGSHIRYHIPFAVPAFVALGVTVTVLATLLALLILRRTGLARLRNFLESTSVGRILAPFLAPSGTGEESKGDLRWIKTIGDRKVTITQDAITADSLELENTRLLNGPGKN